MQKVGRVAALVRESITVEVGNGLAHNACHGDASNQTHEIGGRGNEQRQHGVPVENVADDNVHCSQAGLERKSQQLVSSQKS